MAIPRYILAPSALLTLALVTYPALAIMPSAAVAIDDAVAQPESPAGVWTGNLMRRDWTFSFTANGKVWTGEYMTPGGVKWHPLNRMRVSGRSVSFEIPSKPKLIFALDIDTAAPTMTGTTIIEGMATVPFSATRKS